MGSFIPPEVGGGGGGGSWASRLMGGASGFLKTNPIGKAAGVLGGVFGALGANKKAKIAAENQNSMNKYQHALDRANYGQTDQWRNQKRNRSDAMRQTFLRGIARNKNNPISKLMGRWDEGNATAFDPSQVAKATNIFDTAGPVPKMKAETGGWASALGGALGGLG